MHRAAEAGGEVPCADPAVGVGRRAYRSACQSGVRQPREPEGHRSGGGSGGGRRGDARPPRRGGGSAARLRWCASPSSPVQRALLPGLNGPEHMCIRGWEASDICVGIYMRPWCAVYGTQYCIWSSQRAGTASYAPHTAAPCAGVTLRTLSIFLTCYHSVAASSTADPQHVLLATPPYRQSLSACSAAPFSQRHLFSYTIPLAPHCISNNRYLIIDIPEHLSKYARVWNALGYLSIQGWVRSALDSRLLPVPSAQLPHPSTGGLSGPENMYGHTVLGGIRQRLICIDRASDVLMKHTACHCTVHSFASCVDLSVCVTCQHIAV